MSVYAQLVAIKLAKQIRKHPDIFLKNVSLSYRYKHEIRKEDQEALRKLIKVQYHYQVSPEITRELDASRYAVSDRNLSQHECLHTAASQQACV